MSFDRAESDRLHSQVQALIAKEDLTRAEVETLALEIAAYQARCQPKIARLIQRLGRSATAIRGAAEIVALPTELFALTRVACHLPEEDELVFRTSGTTGGGAARGRHPMRRLDTYDAAAKRWAERHLMPPGRFRAAVSLIPSASSLPDSSLSHMVTMLCREQALDVAWAARPDRGVDAAAADSALALAEQAEGPVMVFGTAFAFVMLLDELPGRAFALPQGSGAMMTGGFKGRSRIVDEAELRQAICEKLGIPQRALVSEYGMTELCSQLYEPRLELEATATGRFAAPPWLLVDAVDPATLELLPRGAVGLARFVDLANVDSAVAVQTQDLVRVESDGLVTLLGRPPGAAPRGCSLSVEAFLRGDA